MKQIIIVFLIGLMVFKAQAQPSLDIGIFGGAGTYFGDMTKIDISKSVNPAYGAFVRYNFNPRYALRFNVLNGTIGAEGEFDNPLWNIDPLTGLFKIDPVTGQPFTERWSFDKNVMDISLQFEWNFFKYIVGDKETPNSTYIFGGIGMQNYGFNDIQAPGGNNSEVAATIPFGLGFKFNLSRRIGLGLEGGMRKTFSDKLDDLDDPLGWPASDEPKYTDRYHNNDWTAYAGIHLVYKLIYGYKRWELTTPKKRILDWGIENNPNNR